MITKDDDRDWAKVFLTNENMEKIYANYGENINAKYSGCANISNEMTNEILEWLRKKVYNKIPLDLPSKLQLCLCFAII